MKPTLTISRAALSIFSALTSLMPLMEISCFLVAIATCNPHPAIAYIALVSALYIPTYTSITPLMAHTASTVCMPASLSLLMSVALIPDCSRQLISRGPCYRDRQQHREPNRPERTTHYTWGKDAATYDLVRLGVAEVLLLLLVVLLLVLSAHHLGWV